MINSFLISLKTTTTKLIRDPHLPILPEPLASLLPCPHDGWVCSLGQPLCLCTGSPFCLSYPYSPFCWTFWLPCNVVILPVLKTITTKTVTINSPHSLPTRCPIFFAPHYGETPQKCCLCLSPFPSILSLMALSPAFQRNCLHGTKFKSVLCHYRFLPAFNTNDHFFLKHFFCFPLGHQGTKYTCSGISSNLTDCSFSSCFAG